MRQTSASSRWRPSSPTKPMLMPRPSSHEYRQYIDHEGTLALMSGWTGIDFSQLRDSMMSWSMCRRRPCARRWTTSRRRHPIASGPSAISPNSEPSAAAARCSWDRPRRWPINWSVGSRRQVSTASTWPTLCSRKRFTDFIDLVIPELQRRGRYKTAYAPGTMRQKLFGEGARLPSNHPAAAYRF